MMTMKEKLSQELARLDSSGLVTGGTHHLAVEHDGRQLLCDIETLDRLGCAVDRLSVSSPALSAASLQRLESIGQALAARLTYLLEPIALLETDADEKTVQLRSQPPHRQHRESTYYELLAGRGRLELRRYLKTPDEPRCAVSAHLTREVLLRLAADMVAAAG